jgi:hypothetical protein
VFTLLCDLAVKITDQGHEYPIATRPVGGNMRLRDMLMGCAQRTDSLTGNGMINIQTKTFVAQASLSVDGPCFIECYSKFSHS